MADVLDLPDDCWQARRATASPRCGDLYEGIPLPSLEEFELFVFEGESAQFFIPVRFSYAVVVRASAGFVSLAPVTTGADVPDPQQFEWIVDQGRTASDFVRLPELANTWEGDALALLLQPQTLPISELQRAPASSLATMDDDAQETFRHRVANAWSA